MNNKYRNCTICSAGYSIAVEMYISFFFLQSRNRPGVAQRVPGGLGS